MSETLSSPQSRGLSELIEHTEELIRSFGHSQSTFYQYQMAWKELSSYFTEHHQILFSKQLAEQYVLAQRKNWKTGKSKSGDIN